MSTDSLSKMNSPGFLAARIPTAVLFSLLISAFVYPNTKNPLNYLRDAYHNSFDYTPKNVSYDQNMPLIFIGGVPRSGTSLVRAILDAHSMVRCGEETHMINRLLGYREIWYQKDGDRVMLENGKITADVMRPAFASFLLEIIVRYGEPAERLCNKDNFQMRYAEFMADLFPNAKFIYVVRDGRAIVHSMVSRSLKSQNYALTDYRDGLTRWNMVAGLMLTQCRKAGPDRCLIVYYEQLVLHPRIWIAHMAKFLNLPWEDVMLNHHLYMGVPGGISVLPSVEPKDPVFRPINQDALHNWVGFLPDGVAEHVSKIAPMLKALGYDSDTGLAVYDYPFNANMSRSPEPFAVQGTPSDAWLMRAEALLQVSNAD